MLHRLVSSLLLLLFTITVVNAQQPCTVFEHYEQIRKQHPATTTVLPAPPKGHDTHRKTSVVDTATHTLAVVVHVVHDYNAENISDDSIFSYVAQWSDVFMKQNADTISVIPTWVPYIGNAKIRLHLATKDPYGNPTKGIERVHSYLTTGGDDQAKFHPWPADRYVNMWLVSSVSAGTAYAYFPWMLDYFPMPWYDGPICDAAEANWQKTMVHELGHYLSVHHTWGDIACGVSCTGTDSVDDTPPTMGHPVTFCVPAALYDTVCAKGYLVHYTDMYGADSVFDYPDTVNAQNIMDYTYCARMFTKGQVARMRATLQSSVAYRNNLVAPSTTTSTGALLPRPDLPPVADFIVGGDTALQRQYFLAVDVPSGFRFRDASWNDTISGISWSFSNAAAIPSSTASTVVNHFAAPGWVTVSLTATSNAGSATLVNNQAVYVADTAVAGASGYTQEFTSSAAISKWPMFNYYNNQFKWQFYTGAGVGDNTCIRYHSFDTSAPTMYPRITGTATGDFDDLFTPAFDLSAKGSIYLNFYTSGASTKTGFYTAPAMAEDTLRIYTSTNGGADWKLAGQYGSKDLANNGNDTSDFIPVSSGQWVARSLEIPAANRSNKTFFRFRYSPGNTGNNMYLDKFKLSSFPSGIMEAFSTNPDMVSVYPTPATNGCSLLFKTGADGSVTYSITDITGNKVYETSKQFAPYSVEHELIPRSLTPAAGVYLINVTIDGVNTIKKLVVY